MNIKVSKLTTAWLDAVDELMKMNSKTLGFLPKPALQSYLAKNNVIGAITDNGELAGYLLFGANRNYFRITHLCVLEKYRRQGIARCLVSTLSESASTQKSIKLNCRHDYPVNNLWPKLGFMAVDEKRSRAREEYFLTRWQLTLAPDEQLQLFQAKTSDDTLDVIIDAQIFFDFYEPDNDKTKPSKALLSDFLVDSLSLWVTDELFNEINRQNDRERREKSRDRAYNFHRIESDRHLVGGFSEQLKELLPFSKPSDESDIRHLAIAAASSVNIFVTRDSALLQKSKEIGDLTGLEVINPVDLIVRMHELTEQQSYIPDRIAGLSLRWERLKYGDLASLPLDSFLKHEETKGRFREKLESLVANPNRYDCELLRSGKELMAIRVLEECNGKILCSPLARVAVAAKHSLFGHFLIADTVSRAVEKSLDMVEFQGSALTTSLIPNLLEMGFIKHDDTYVRFCFSRVLRRGEALSTILELCPKATTNYHDMSCSEFEKRCSPLVMEATELDSFLISIRPAYAMSLFDRHQSADDLFGGDPNVLLRWNNVYYRSVTHHKMLRAPARILWYVSQNQKQIVAVSYLDDVSIATPKELFKRFKKFGILEWKDLYKMCGGNPSKKLMALRFSHSFVFREPVPLDVVRSIFKENQAGLTLQGPLRLKPEIFCELYQRGFPI